MRRLVWTAACLAATLSATVARAEDGVPSDTPKALLDWIYGTNHGQPDDRPEKLGLYFTPDILVLDKRRQALADSGQLDGMDDDVNPFCSCQDTDKPRYRLTVKATAPSRAEADVIYANNGETIHYHFFMQRTPSGWRVSDFREVGNSLDHDKHTRITSTYKQDLISEIRTAEKTKPHTY